MRKASVRNKFLKEIEKTVKARGGKAEQSIEALNVPIGKVKPDPDQPRSEPDPESEDIQALRRSIRAFGILEPLLVVRDGQNYRLISGQRRFVAARAEQRSHVPVRVLKLRQDISRIRLIQLTENIQRKDLNALEISRCLNRIVEEKGVKQSELAEKLGLSQPAVNYYLSLKKLHRDCVAVIEERPDDFSLKRLIKVARLKTRREQLAALRGPEKNEQKKIPEVGAYKWRPRLRFQFRSYKFDVVRSKSKRQNRIKLEVPNDMDPGEIAKAFKDIYRTMTGLDWGSLDNETI